MSEAPRCPHFDGTAAEPNASQCESCGSTSALRVCTTCGYVGCCESQQAHDRRHAKTKGHPVIQSLPPGPRQFTWCYECNAYI